MAEGIIKPVAEGAVYPSLAGKRVIVSGGGTGIGEGIVEAFARQGAAVAFVDVQDGASEALVARLAQGASASFAGIKALCAGAPGRPFEEHLAMERKLLRERAGSADAREGVAAFMAKRAPRFIGR